MDPLNDALNQLIFIKEKYAGYERDLREQEDAHLTQCHRRNDEITALAVQQRFAQTTKEMIAVRNSHIDALGTFYVKCGILSAEEWDFLLKASNPYEKRDVRDSQRVCPTCRCSQGSGHADGKKGDLTG